jgi:hypothetical protein
MRWSINLVRRNLIFNNWNAFCLEDVREQEPHCVILWSDTKKVEVIDQSYIRLSPSQQPKNNVTYTIIIDGVRRNGTVLAAGIIFLSSIKSQKLL